MGHGDHWECIVTDMKEAIMNLLPLAISKGVTVPGDVLHLGFLNDEEGGVVEGEFDEMPVGLVHDHGPFTSIVLVVPTIDKKSKYVWSVYPCLSKGVQVEITIKEIKPWENRIEAEISGETTDGLNISFFDLFYFRNAKKYQVGKTFNFELGAIAFSLHRATNMPIYINDPDVIAAMRQGTEEEGVLDPIEIQTEGMAALIPIKDWDSYEYNFQGTVKSSQTMIGNGKKFLRLDITVMRNEMDFDLPVLIAPHVVEDYWPEVGQDVTGRLWVHGRLIE